ncbi:zinc finger A20 and AN1 domain-containing stress-associated protein 4-like [Impatiens glandulifera]|uniref:zinc finger A20 and AN1 domain-containing stress-associated protein 4-like n=1 Tax=Impatiens glandulifera TaxID=253017 RepID=UPI001FB08AEE|nr:zinc finger A20 and AN1 domain-containing stress-associated protein 4-like [Impatiens glandulifera]
MEHNETGCHPATEGPILCINNCGFFGSAATMNMCSKCHKDVMMKEEQAKLAASSIETIVNGSSSAAKKETVDLQAVPYESKYELRVEQRTADSDAVYYLVEKKKEGPIRCTTCNKRVGLTGFKCRCENMFCGTHRYSDKHDCSFDYRGAGQDAIAKANPVVKAEKLNKI